MGKICFSCSKFIHDEKLVDDDNMCLFCRERHSTGHRLVQRLCGLYPRYYKPLKDPGGYKSVICK